MIKHGRNTVDDKEIKLHIPRFLSRFLGINSWWLFMFLLYFSLFSGAPATIKNNAVGTLYKWPTCGMIFFYNQREFGKSYSFYAIFFNWV